MVALKGWVASDGYPFPIQQLTLKDLVQNRRHMVSYNWINNSEEPLKPIVAKPTCKDGKLSHHWMIEQTGKSKSMGTCTICGKSYEFTNTATVRTGRRENNG